MSMTVLLLTGWLLVASLMLVLWLIQRARGNAGIVDLGWAGGIAALAIYFAIASEGLPARRMLVGGLLAVWGIRLAWHLGRRIAREPEDGRYQEMRRWAGPQTQTYFFWFYQAQAVSMVLLALAALIAMRHPATGLGLTDLLGALVWLTSVIGESVADRQLAAFRADPANRGKTCRVGLWRYSRHPNYFFEWVHWWTYCLIAIGAPYAWLTLIGPAGMLYLILYVTGIPPTERQALRSRGEDYRAYQRETSAFFPWIPRSAARASG